jgi:hypothetical protein
MPADLTPEEVSRSHRWHAIECNNLAWRLADQATRTSHEDEVMLNAAHASAFHWAQVGTELNLARAKMLLAHVHAALRHGEIALGYARQSHEFLAASGPPDWEIAFSHAVFAHAASSAGDEALHQHHFARAQELGNAIADPEDKDIFFKTFALIPSP